MSLRRDKDTLFAVAGVADRVQGFVIARLVPSPPVYEPGGTTCLVDDFTFADVQMWPEVGPLLLDRARASAADHGAAQLVVVTAGRDDAKRAVLHAGDLTAASEWWVGAVSRTN